MCVLHCRRRRSQQRPKCPWDISPPQSSDSDGRNTLGVARLCSRLDSPRTLTRSFLTHTASRSQPIDWRNRVAAITLSFRVIKIPSTTVGETGADFLAGVSPPWRGSTWRFAARFVMRPGLASSSRAPVPQGERDAYRRRARHRALDAGPDSGRRRAPRVSGLRFRRPKSKTPTTFR